MSDAILNFHHGVTYVAAIWYIGGRGKDFLCSVTREKDDASFKLTYRLRNHRDDSVEVHEAVYEGQDGEPGAIQGADDLAEAFVGLGYGPTVHKLLLQTTDVFLILDRLSKAPWAEVRHVGPPIGIA